MPINYKKYPANWLTEIRPAILEREGHRCKKCNIPNHTPGYRDAQKKFIEVSPEVAKEYKFVSGGFKIFKIVLTIAHLDHNVDNNDPKNLAALCQSCHLGTDRMRAITSKKYGKEHRTNQLTMEF